MTTTSITERNESFAVPSAPCDDTDARVLERFILFKDDDAFAELVRRHGPMVLGVAQRILQNPHDAEDCFQAAFLVLTRKADTIVPRQMVGNWLYGVAYRTALEARKLAARRRSKERMKHEMPMPESSADRWDELRPLLDQELSRLPDDFRVVIVLCDIEGKTRAEAARELGVPEGTVASRLARGRALLSKRLSRYSLGMSAAGIMTALAGGAAEAEVPPELAWSAVHAAQRALAGGRTGGVVSARVAELADAVGESLGAGKLPYILASLLILLAFALGVGTLLPTALASKKPLADEIQHHGVGVPPANMKSIEGMMDAYNENTVTIECDDSKGLIVKKKYELDSQSVILIDGKKAKLADLKKKMKVTIYISPLKPVVKQIQVSGPKIVGVIERVDVDQQTIAVAERCVPVEKDAPIVIEGKPGKLRDLKPGTPVALQLSAKDEAGVVVVGITAGPAKK